MLTCAPHLRRCRVCRTLLEGDSCPVCVDAPGPRLQLARGKVTVRDKYNGRTGMVLAYGEGRVFVEWADGSQSWTPFELLERCR